MSEILTRRKFLEKLGTGMASLFLPEFLRNVNIQSGCYDVSKFGGVETEFRREKYNSVLHRSYLEAFDEAPEDSRFERAQKAPVTFEKEEFLKEHDNLGVDSQTRAYLDNEITRLDCRGMVTIIKAQPIILVNLEAHAKRFDDYEDFVDDVDLTMAAEMGHVVAFMNPENDNDFSYGQARLLGSLGDFLVGGGVGCLAGAAVANKLSVDDEDIRKMIVGGIGLLGGVIYSSAGYYRKASISFGELAHKLVDEPEHKLVSPEDAKKVLNLERECLF